MWTVIHNKILIGDNLKKKGWEGPTRCPFCLNNEEKAEHILISCQYTRDVWKASLPKKAELHSGSLPDLFLNWASKAPFSLK